MKTTIAPGDRRRGTTAASLSAAQRNELRDELLRARMRVARAEIEAEHASPQFQAIQRALDRMNDGSYGGCVACGAAIPYGRLLVLPETTHCVGCPS